MIAHNQRNHPPPSVNLPTSTPTRAHANPQPPRRQPTCHQQPKPSPLEIRYVTNSADTYPTANFQDMTAATPNSPSQQGNTTPHPKPSTWTADKSYNATQPPRTPMPPTPSAPTTPTNQDHRTVTTSHFRLPPAALNSPPPSSDQIQPVPLRRPFVPDQQTPTTPTTLRPPPLPQCHIARHTAA